MCDDAPVKPVYSRDLDQLSRNGKCATSLAVVYVIHTSTYNKLRLRVIRERKRGDASLRVNQSSAVGSSQWKTRTSLWCVADPREFETIFVFYYVYTGFKDISRRYEDIITRLIVRSGSRSSKGLQFNGIHFEKTSQQWHHGISIASLTRIDSFLQMRGVNRIRSRISPIWAVRDGMHAYLLSGIIWYAQALSTYSRLSERLYIYIYV